MTSDNDLLETRLTAAFDAAHHDPRWAPDVWPDPLPRVRHGARAARSRQLVMAAVATLGILGGAAVGLHAVTGSTQRLTAVPSAGVSGGSGADWLLTPAEYDAYTAAHPSPSPVPERVPSPAPETSQVRQFQSDVLAAVGGGASTLRVDPADSGEAGHVTLWLRVGATPLAVEHYRLTYPLLVGPAQVPPPTAEPGHSSPDSSYEHFTAPQTWPTGTAYTIATGEAFGYAFGIDEHWAGPIVWAVTPDGWLTWWTAPVPADRLLGWAQAYDSNTATG
jgi:hypothetical protein